MTGSTNNAPIIGEQCMAIHSREKKDMPTKKKPGGSDGGGKFRKRGQWVIEGDSAPRNRKRQHEHSPPAQNKIEGQPQ